MNILTTSGPFRCRHRTVFRNLAELKLRPIGVDISRMFWVFQCEGASPGYVPSLINNIRPQIAHERIESPTRPRQRLGIPHLLSIRFPPCVRLLMWEVRRCLVFHEGGRAEKACSHNPSTECGWCGTETGCGSGKGFSHDRSLRTLLMNDTAR